MMSQLEFEEARILTPEEVSNIEARKQAAIRTAQEAPGTRTEHVRLSIDFHISVAGTPPNDDGMNEPDPIYHARQVRLLAAVKSNPAVLKQWIHSLIVGQMYHYGWREWDNLLGREVSLQAILAPALSTLPEDDQVYLADVPKGEYFDDKIDLFSASFIIHEDQPIMRDIEEECEQGEKA
jgi:hypothetical protein